MSVLRGVVWAIPGHCRSGLSGSEPRPAHIPHLHILHEVLPRPEASRASFEIVTGLNVVQLLQMEREPAPAEGPTQPHSQRCSRGWLVLRRGWGGTARGQLNLKSGLLQLPPRPAVRTQT